MDNIAVVRGREDLLAQLREEQEKSNYISEQFIKQTAQTMGLSVSDVYVIRVCKSIPCNLKSSKVIVETVQAELGIEPGETTQDGKFSLLLTNCIGACDQAPAMLLNHDLHGNLTSAKIAKILQACQ
jgi:NADH-quinone oxidoreductase subunit E